jgi:biotin carboxyl carrier protein
VKSDALTVFSELKELASFAGDESAFWARFAECCAALCRSPLALVLSVTQDQWRETSLFSRVDLDETLKSQLARQTLSLYKRMQGRSFIFEPFRAAGWALASPFLICFQVCSPDKAQTFLVSVIAEHDDLDRFNDVVVRTQLLSSVYSSYQNFTSLQKSAGAVTDTSLLYVLEVLDDVVAQKKFTLACMTLVNALMSRFGCAKVSLGWKLKTGIKAVALSHLESFDKNSQAIAELEGLFDEAADQEKDIILPRQTEDPNLISHNHDEYRRIKGLTQLISLPLSVDNIPAGVITIENVDRSLTAKEISLIAIAVNQAAPWLAELYERNLWPVTRAGNGLRRHLAWWLGPNRTLTKFAILAFLAALTASCLLKMDFRLEAQATLETDNVSYLSAPYHGFIQEVKVHSGDQVSKGEVLIRMDTEELELKELEEEANVFRFTREAEKARSNRSLVDMKVALARVKQAEAELTRIRYYIEQAKIKSPLDGVVVDGDKVELQGAPVSKGDLLLKVANPTQLYPKIKINEKDVDYVRLQAPGRLKLLSQPESMHPLIIDKIIPVAELDPEEGNVFLLKARLTEEPNSWWRPGMSGVVYIDAGRRRVIWLLLHNTIDAIRMRLWF